MLGISLRAGGQRFPPATWCWVWPLSYFHRQQERRRNKRDSQLFNFLPGNWLHIHVQCLVTFVLVMTNQNFLLSDQDGVWVGHYYYYYVPSREKNYLQPWYLKVRKILEITTCITDLYNPLEQNRVMNFLPWGLVNLVLKSYLLYLFQKNIQCVQNMINGSIDALERWYKKVDSKVSVCIINLEWLH